MTAPAAGPVAAFLAETKAEVAEYAEAGFALACGDGHAGTLVELSAAENKLAGRVPALVTALEAVLALAGEWLASDLGTLDRAQIRQACAESIHEAIESALRDAQGGQP